MKKILVITMFMLAMLAFAAAQQPGSPPEQSSGQATPPSSQPPSAPVTEGCLGGSNPNFTLTNEAGITYKLNIPPNADTSRLASHVGESVQVEGDVKDTGKSGNPSIDVQSIGKGTGKCPAGGSKGAHPPKQ